MCSALLLSILYRSTSISLICVVVKEDLTERRGILISDAVPIFLMSAVMKEVSRRAPPRRAFVRAARARPRVSLTCYLRFHEWLTRSAPRAAHLSISHLSAALLTDILTAARAGKTAELFAEMVFNAERLIALANELSLRQLLALLELTASHW